ncbi:hypothetical protein BJV77DRAFT_1034065 [Russula vinacea]|nr:hypothetical protein BJV77DRAFT_1034065 [Russula vinacea]
MRYAYIIEAMPNMLPCIRSVGPNFGHPTEQPKSRKGIMPFSFQFLAGRCALSNPRKPNVEQEVSLESSRVRIPTSRVRRKISHPQRRFGIGIGTRVGSMDLEYGCGDCGSRRLLQSGRTLLRGLQFTVKESPGSTIFALLSLLTVITTCLVNDSIAFKFEMTMSEVNYSSLTNTHS